MFMKKPQAQEEKAPALPPRLTPAQAEAALRAKEVELATRELEEEARFRREQAEAERQAWRDSQAQKDQETKAVQTRAMWSNVVARVVPYLPLVLVNIMAVMGQFGWGRDNLDQIGSSAEDPVRWAIAILFAGALESLALFQGYYADRALQRRDSAAGLYAGAFGTAAIVAALNYSHYASDKETLFSVGGFHIPAPTPTAVVFALFSFISPALWRIHSRAKNRDTLKAAGEIDTRAPRLAWSKKLWHPIRTTRAMYWATWEKDVVTPADVMDLYESKMAAKRAVKEAKTLKASSKTQDKKEEKALTSNKVQEPPAPEDDPVAEDNVVQIVAQRFPEAWEAYVRAAEGGNPLTQRALAKEYLGNNRHHARSIIAAWKTWKGVPGDDHDVRSSAA